MHFHSESSSWNDYLFTVWGGISFWFTSALAVAELILILLMALSSKNSIWFYAIMTFFISLLGVYLNMNRTSNSVESFFPWYYQTGLVYTFLMVLGGVYRCYEMQIDKILKRGMFILLFIYILLVVYGWNSPERLKMFGLNGTCNILGYICLLTGIAILIIVSKRLGSVKWLEYIGRNSIVFYFFSGTYPAIVGYIVTRTFPNSNYTSTIGATIIAVLMAYVASMIINKYLPFTIDLRRLSYGKK